MKPQRRSAPCGRDHGCRRGELRRSDAYEHPDLFWGLKGGGGNFGVVTSLEFALYPLTTVYGGGLYYPVERATEILDLYRQWNVELPDEITTSVTFLNFPHLPELPEPLRGRSVITMRACYCGDPPEQGGELLRPWRELVQPLFDSFRTMPYREMDVISMDPVDPLGAYTHVELLRELSPEGIETLVEIAGVDSDSPLMMLELRQLGGALVHPPADLSPVGPGDSQFTMTGIGVTPTPEVARRVQAYLGYVAETMRPYETGATYVNFLELDGATPERVRAAYSPDDWERLVALKKRYDPDNVLRFNRNIPPSLARE